MQINSFGIHKILLTQNDAMGEPFHPLNINEQSINIRKHPQYDYSYYQ